MVTSYTKLTTGLVLELDLRAHTASQIRQVWDAETPVFSWSQGSYQDLSNGHVLLGHGNIPLIVEYDANGACVMTARFGYDTTTQSYRAYRYPWIGRPKTKPTATACSIDEDTIVFISWNGASDVQAWKIYTGSDAGSLEPMQTVLKNGFETRVLLEGVSNDFIKVQAVGGVNDGTKSEFIPITDRCSE